jgi:ABC-type phosphate transport system auxiliary subunit
VKTTREIALEKENTALRKELKVLKMQLDSLQNQFNAVLIMFQGKKSEKRTIDLNQLGLFPQ